ncbi:hypothetical protein BE04_47695 [Sorangium cellulosum]|uniref:AAA+ ATPase domain-containing protein n=1 Tax=Sorangium cellulosum TaxID=56 RepID=A0A150NY77_SORCE|nr:hypothetical protein BE04_47695 [Sorangium cellulosum]
MPEDPRYGFSGRGRELLDIERALLRGKIVLLHGFGGTGKTALAAEAARWLCRTGMYRGACFVSFEHGGDAARVLGRLAEHLGVSDGGFDAGDATAALARLVPALVERPTLLVADNLESVLPGGDAALPAGERAALWQALVQLATASKGGCGVILTSRDAALGDGRLAPGQRAMHREVGGMDPDDAHALAARLLGDLGIDPRRAPYPELRDLLQKLDHHPLAIQLVLRALGDTTLTLKAIDEEFATLLPRFTDDTETGRSRSLMASLEYSLRRLSEEQRELLVRLAPFEGGASEDDLLAITEIPEAAWAKLRPALEQAALIRAEQVHQAVRVPFLRFHPVLAPYLRMRAGAEDEGLRERYAKRYAQVAHYLYNRDGREPTEARALARVEMPNLRRALHLRIAAGARDEAANMADSLARFLRSFGYGRELEQIRRQVEEPTEPDGPAPDGNFTLAEYLRESGFAEDALHRGDIHAAFHRVTALLQRIQDLPEGTARGRGSYEHCLVLTLLGRCFEAGGRPATAEARYQEALHVLETLIERDREQKAYVRHRGVLLAELGDILSEQGKYGEARSTYKDSLEIMKSLNDARGQAVALAQLGTLAMHEQGYPEAKQRYREAIAFFGNLQEPRAEAAAWHQLGLIFKRERNWDEAERCLRLSIGLEEDAGNAAGAAGTCGELGSVARLAGRAEEAELWYRKALKTFEDLEGAASQAIQLNNLAALIQQEVRAGRYPTSRLAEARALADQCLKIKSNLDAYSQIWTTLEILASIAEQEGDKDAARGYRREARETFAAFPGNRYGIDKRFGDLISLLAAAATQPELHSHFEPLLSKLEAAGWHIAAPVRRLWAGERDWHALAEGLDGNDALLVLRVLETLAGTAPPPAEP